MAEIASTKPSLPSAEDYARFAHHPDFEVEEIPLANGTKLQIGRPRGSASAQAQKAAAASSSSSSSTPNAEPLVFSHGPSFDEGNFRWPCPSSAPTEDWFSSKTGISSYTLEVVRELPLGWKFCKCTFQTAQTYDYYFFDASGAAPYECDVWLAGSHWFTYTTTDPDLVRVTGS